MNINEEYIIKNYKKYPISYFTQNTDFKINNIIDIYLTNNLNEHQRSWTKIEEENLIFLAQYKKTQEIVPILNRSLNSVRQKAKDLNISFLKIDRNWTKEDIQTLRDLFGTKSYEFIAKTLNRTVFAVKRKAANLKLGKMKDNNYEYLTIKEISDILKISYSKVRKWKEKGLKLRKFRVTKDTYYYRIKLDDLLEFLKQNQELWDSKNIEPNTFYKEENWYIEKRRRDLLKKEEIEKKWTIKEVNYALELYKKNYSYKKIADILGVTVASVSNHLSVYKKEKQNHNKQYISRKRLCKDLKINLNTFNIWLEKGLVIEKRHLPTRTEIIISKQNLITFLKNNQELWEALNLDNKFLNINEEWFLKKLNTELQKPHKSKTYLKK